MNGLEIIWKQVLNKIQLSLEQSGESTQFMSFFEGCELSHLSDDKAIITTTLNINRIMLKTEIDRINAAFKEVLGFDINCDIKDFSDYNKSQITEQITKALDDRLVSEFTFDNFVVGPSNIEAKTAALACAMQPGRRDFCPLVIYGDSGLGKTHLLNAIGNFIKQHDPDKRILYIPSMTFVNEVVKSIKDNTIEEYKNQLNELDVLLVDDIQTLSGKTKTNDVFFSIYNELFNNKKQVVLTSDRPPGEIKDIEDRLKTRFSQGLSVTITSLEFETAYKILEMKIKHNTQDDLNIEPEVISFLASNFASDVRNLEGALNRLLFYAINFSKSGTIDLPLAIEAFKDQSHVIKEKKELSSDDIIKAVADYYNLTKQQIKSKNRTKNIANARHISMYLCRKHLDYSYLKIGEVFGGRDHTTVLSACEKIESNIKKDDIYKKIISDIEKNIPH